EPDQHRQADAAQHQVIGELFEIDRPRRVFRRVHEHVARRRDGEVPLAPALHLIELAGVGDGENLTRLPGPMAPSCREVHELHDTHLAALAIRKIAENSIFCFASFRLKAEASRYRESSSETGLLRSSWLPPSGGNQLAATRFCKRSRQPRLNARRVPV